MNSNVGDLDDISSAAAELDLGALETRAVPAAAEGGRDPWGPSLGSRGSPRTWNTGEKNTGGDSYAPPVCSTGESFSPAPGEARSPKGLRLSL